MITGYVGKNEGLDVGLTKFAFVYSSEQNEIDCGELTNAALSRGVQVATVF